MRNTEIKVPVTVVPAANATYDVSLPDGHYWMALAVKSDLTGTTTTIAVTPFVDQARSQISNLAYRLYEADDTVAIAVLTMPANAAGRMAVCVPTVAGAENFTSPVYVAGGVRVSVVKGGATTGELLQVTLIATRVE